MHHLPCYASFEDMQLHPQLLRNVHAYGLDKPTPVQQQVIVPMSLGCAFVACTRFGNNRVGTYEAQRP